MMVVFMNLNLVFQPESPQWLNNKSFGIKRQNKQVFITSMNLLKKTVSELDKNSGERENEIHSIS